MALRITREALEQIVRQARKDHPIESCGIVAATVGEMVAHRVVMMKNKAASSKFFRFDSQEQFRVYRDLESRDEECVAIYHSHTGSEAYPSKDDVDHAGYPEVHYLIVSTWEHAKAPIRSFRIIDGGVTEERIFIVESLLDQQGSPIHSC